MRRSSEHDDEIYDDNESSDSGCDDVVGAAAQKGGTYTIRAGTVDPEKEVRSEPL